MKNAFIIHGSNGSKDAHWYPWLEEKLKEEGYEVVRPQFPIKEEQILSNWLKTLKPYKEKLDVALVFAHSLGVPFFMNVLNRWDVSCRAVFLVSGFVGCLEAEGEPNLDDFSDREFDWEKIRKSAEEFVVFHSDNDPYVPLKRAEDLAEKLGTKVRVIKDGEHFQACSGYKKFEELLKPLGNFQEN